MVQDIKIYNALSTDNTIKDLPKRDKEIESILIRFENLLKEYFPTEYTRIDANNKKQSMFILIRHLKNNFDNIFPENKDKALFIGKSLETNNAWKSEDKNGFCYDESYVIYRSLCHSTHNSISSVQDRTVRDGYYMFNNDRPNVAAALSLDYWCMRDIYEQVLEIYKNAD